MSTCVRGLRSFPPLLLAAVATTTTASAPPDVYRFFSLRDVAESPAGRTSFQDFSFDEDTVGMLWADPDAESHSGGPAWVRAHVDRSGGRPALSIRYDRQGYGAHVEILPYRRVPMPIRPGDVLLLEIRADRSVCVGLRIMERDGEVWAHADAKLRYRQMCPAADGSWSRFSIPLDADPIHWNKYPFAGNSELGSGRAEFDLLATIQLEFGFGLPFHLGAGAGTLEVRDIRVVGR